MSAVLADTIVEWKSRGLSNEKIRPPINANHSISPKQRWMNNSIIRVDFKRSCLKQDKTTFTPPKCSKFIYCI